MSVLHTVMPLEVVLGNAWAGACPGVPAGVEGPAPWGPAGQGVAAATTVPLGPGRFLELEPGPAGPVIRRLYSTNPHDYLDPRFQPGTPFPGR